jgi:hypothetical protein
MAYKIIRDDRQTDRQTDRLIDRREKFILCVWGGENEYGEILHISKFASLTCSTCKGINSFKNDFFL